MGRYVGDGWTKKTYKNGKICRGGIIICCSKVKETDYYTLKNAIENCGLTFYVGTERTVYRFTISSVEIYEFVQRYSNGAYNKTIDGETLNLPVELLTSFLNGYKDSDGSFTQDKYKLTSVSRNLIYSAGQCVAKALSTHYHTYHAPMPPTHIIEGRVVNQKDQYQLVWDTKERKQYKAFYESGHIWFPVNKIEKQILEQPVMLYQLLIEDDSSYNAYSVVLK